MGNVVMFIAELGEFFCFITPFLFIWSINNLFKCSPKDKKRYYLYLIVAVINSYLIFLPIILNKFHWVINIILNKFLGRFLQKNSKILFYH